MLEYMFDFYKGKSKKAQTNSTADIESNLQYWNGYGLLSKLLELKEADSHIWIVIVGLNHYHGTKPFYEGLKVHFIKEPGNNYDPYAIMAICDNVGRCGYIANSAETIRPYTLLAELLHGGISDSCIGEVMGITDEYIICRIKDISYCDLIFNYGVNFYREKNISDALLFFEAIEDEYATLELFQRMSMCYLHFSNFTKAREYAKKAMLLDSNNQLTKQIIEEIFKKLND